MASDHIADGRKKVRLVDANTLEERVKISDKPAWMIVRDAPTVDAVEVVHGQWKNITDFGNGDCYGFCSVCAAEQHEQNASALKAFHRYCRWCGAKMDGERKDNESKAD